MEINALIVKAKEFYKNNQAVLECLLELEDVIKAEEVRS